MTNQIAQTIANQIGNMALTMLGASNLLADASSLTFKVGRNARKVTHLRVTLDPSDTYTVEAIKVRGFDVTTLATDSDVYADNLRPVIETMTGMYTRL